MIIHRSDANKRAVELGAVKRASYHCGQPGGGVAWISDHFFNADGLEVMYSNAIGTHEFDKPRVWGAEALASLDMEYSLE